MPEIVFQREKGLVLFSGEFIDTNFHFTDKCPFYINCSYVYMFISPQMVDNRRFENILSHFVTLWANGLNNSIANNGDYYRA